MTIRPEDYGGTTDPLAAFANTSTMPGRGVGKAIDPSRPSLEKCSYPDCSCPVSFPPGYKPSTATECPTTDRIAELKRERAKLVKTSRLSNVSRIVEIDAKLSRLSNEQPELNSRGEPMDAATIARGRRLDELHVKFRAASNITAFTLADIEMLLNIADGRIAAKQAAETTPTPTPSSAGLIEAAELLEQVTAEDDESDLGERMSEAFNEGYPKSPMNKRLRAFVQPYIVELRARAADRSAT